MIEAGQSAYRMKFMICKVLASSRKKHSKLEEMAAKVGLEYTGGNSMSRLVSEWVGSCFVMKNRQIIAASAKPRIYCNCDIKIVFPEFP